jgi:hypothetical protein
MNRNALLLLMALCLPALLSAADGLLLGGGVNFSSTDEDWDGVDAEPVPHTGFNVGIAFEKQLATWIYLAPGISLETRGERREGEFLDEPLEWELRLLYLQMPLLYIVKVPVGRGSIQVFAGPALGINLVAERMLKIGEPDSSGGSDGTDDIKDLMAATDIGVEFGVGVEVPVGGGSLFFRPAYYLGVSEVLETGEKLRNLKLQIGYRIPLGP